MSVTVPGDQKQCPKCPRKVPIALRGGRLVWPAHKPGKGKRVNCPQSGEPYREA